jgi:hypothetical protein
MTGTFKDVGRANEISVYTSSEKEVDSVWLTIQDMFDVDKTITSQLAPYDCKLLIAILEKALADMED